MAASGAQRSPWVITLLVALIGAMGVIGAAVLLRLIGDETTSPGSTSSPGYTSGPGSTTTPTTRINEVEIQAEATAERSGDLQVRSDAGISYLSYITAGAWAAYDDEGLGAGKVQSITAKVASATAGGDIDIRLDGSNGHRIGRCSVPGTGGWSSWDTITCDIEDDVPSEPALIYLRFNGTSTRENPYLFNVDWVRFS